MADFIDIIKEFELNPGLTSDDWQGTIVYRQADNPSPSASGNVIPEASLPSLGDAFPAARIPSGIGAAPVTFICRKISISYEGGDETKNRMYRFEYGTKDSSNENSPSDEDTQYSLTTGSEFIVKSTAKATNAQKIKCSTTENVINEITFWILTANYSVTVPGYTTLQAALDASNPMSNGTVSSASENWLFLGTNINQYRDDEGNTRFRATRTYSYKEFQGPGGRIDSTGWQAVWCEKLAKWVEGDPLTYGTSAFVDTMPTI